MQTDESEVAPLTVLEDKAAISREITRLWNLYHGPVHRGVTLEKAMQNPFLAQILRAHALLNLKHGVHHDDK